MPTSQRCTGTTQNDIIKEYLSRGTYVVPARAVDAADHRHDRLHGDGDARSGTRSTSAATTCRRPGATPAQELAYALCTAIAVLDCGAGQRAGAGRAVRRRGRADLVLRERRRAVRRGDVQDAGLRPHVGRAHPRPVRRARSAPPAVPLRRAGQLARPDRGAAGEQRHPDRARVARRDAVSRTRAARALQLPAWNEALGLPRPWDQQWSLRIQQILAYETDLLEYDDLFEGSVVVERKVDGAGRAGPGRDRPGPGAWAARSRRSRAAT